MTGRTSVTFFWRQSEAILSFRDVTYPISLQNTTLDGVTSSLLTRNVQSTYESARYSPNKLNGKLHCPVQDGGIKESFIF